MNEAARAYLERLAERSPELADCTLALSQACETILAAFRRGGKLLIAGNGGSFSDALHIAGELMKRFERHRHLSPADDAALARLPYGNILRAQLEPGLPAIPLGHNGALLTAIVNDLNDPRVIFAQECLALGRAGDVLLGISTSGNAVDVLMATSVAKTRGMTVVALTGPGGGEMAPLADIAIRAPGEGTARIQENHVRLYHTLCAAIEADQFPNDSEKQ